MGSSPTGASTMAKIPPWRTSSMDKKNDTVANTTTLFAREVPQRLSFLGNLNPSYKKVGLGELQFEAPFFPFSSLHTPSCLSHQPLPRLTLSLLIDRCTSSLSLNLPFDPCVLVVWFHGIWNQPSGS